MDGKLVDWNDAKVHVLTHALHYGSGVFEGIRCYDTEKGPAVFRLKEHLERLQKSAHSHLMKVPYSTEELSKATKELIKANNLAACYIRHIVFRGYGEMGLNPLDAPIVVSIAVWPWGAYLGEEGLKKGVTTKISPFQRMSPKYLPPEAKGTGQYENSALAKVDALESGVDEAIMLDDRGLVAEGPGENIFLVKNGKIFTPKPYAILQGITRESVMQIARQKGFEVIEKDITKEELFDADELFFTGTAAEMTPIREVDGMKIGNGARGPVTEKIQKRFFEILKKGEPSEWFEFVD